MASEDPSGVMTSADSGNQALEQSEAARPRFSPEQEKALIEESAEKKAKANELFNSGESEEALIQYGEALSSCPDYKHFERAVLHSNIAACQLKLEEWKDAIKAASTALDTLLTMERELGLVPEAKPEPPKKDDNSKHNDDSESKPKDTKGDATSTDSREESGTSENPEPAFTPANVPEAIKNDIKRIRIKSLLRRARARAESGGWSNLAAAEEDYKTLSNIPGLAAADAKTVRMQLVRLPPLTKAAQEKEMSEMWGKLKNLGDGILKPFGLSTNNFQMVKDDATGGYSMNFQGNQGS